MSGLGNEARRGVVIPHLTCAGAEKALEFYAKAFGGEVTSKQYMGKSGSDGRVMHSELKLFNSLFFVVDDFPEWRGGHKGDPLSLGGTGCVFHFVVDHCDEVYHKACKEGCTGTMPPADQFWGDRYCSLTDPFGHKWAFSTPLGGDPSTWPKRPDFEAPPEKKPKGE